MKKDFDIHKVDYTMLTHSFQDACADKEFKDYVYHLNAKEDVLMKYTSGLQDSFQEYKNCLNCDSIESCPNYMKGYRLTPKVEGNIISFSYDECKKQQKVSYKENLDLYHLSSTLKDASFKNIYKDDKARLPILKQFKEFIEHYNDEEKPKGIYLSGSFGSGKTYLIAALLNEMAKKGVKSILVYFPELLIKLKAAFKDDYEEQLDELKNVPLLLLDDIGAENVSNWSRDEVLGPILQYRMENELPTFFTSNLTLEELEEALAITSSGVNKLKARRIIERIRLLTVPLELISKNRRD